MSIIYKLIIPFLFFTTQIFAQEAQNEESEGNFHKIALVFGYTLIPSGFEDGEETESVFVPTIGVDYFMQFENRWKVGAVMDLELKNYIVKFNREPLNRERALITGIVVGYEFENHWSFLLGPAIEFEKNKNLFILRSSIEYEFELENGWGVFPAFNYDFKEEYSTWSINIGISKRL